MKSTVAVTVLFTDLVGSTAIGTSLPPAEADDLRSTHFGILREAIAAADGTEVKNLGDGLMVAFASPSRALACAVGMQQAIERHNRQAPVALSVRIGIAGGEATEEDGDYFGDPVVEAARLCAVANGSQILATETVRAMVGRHAPAELSPFGDLDLKGIPDPVPTVEVRWSPASSDADFPLPGRLAGASTGGAFSFAGRAAEVSGLDEVCKHAAAGGLHVALIGGEPGMGKTSLAAEAARLAQRGGAAVVFGSCQEGVGVPYQPWIMALAHLVSHAPEAVVTGLRPVHAGALRALLPSVRERLPAGESVDAGPDTERYLRLEAMVELLERASAELPVVVVLDDLQWADAATLAVVRHLIAASTAMRVAIIATYRDSDLSRDHPMTSLLAELRREPTVTRIDLSGLDDVEIVELMEAAAGYELPPDGVDLAHALRRETGGNPFFTVELLRNLAETGALTVESGGRYTLAGRVNELSLPSSVREVVAHRVARLGDEVLDALSVAAVIGQDFDLDVLAAVTKLDEDDLIDVLERAETAALVAESVDVPGRYRFVHALIAHTLTQDLGSTRRQRTHQRIAEALEAMGAEQAGRVAELAHHWLAATRPADPERALYFARRAGEAALAALAPLDALGWFSQALELLDRRPVDDEAQRAWVLVGLGRAQLDAGQPEYRVTLRAAGTIALRLHDGDLLVAVALCRIVGYEDVSLTDPDRFAVIEAALVAVGPADSFARARLLAALADETDRRDWQNRRQLCNEAIAIARRLNDDHALLEVFALTMALLIAPDTLDERRELADLAVSVSGRVDAPLAELVAFMSRRMCCAETADLIGVDECWTHIEAVSERIGTPYSRWQVLLGRSWRRLLEGRVAESDALATEAFEVGTGAGTSSAAPSFGAQMMMIRIQQGRLDEIIDLIAQGVEDFETLPGWDAALALLYCELGRLDETRTLFETACAHQFSGVPFDVTWLLTMMSWGECAAELHHRDAAALLSERLRPYEERVIFTNAHTLGAVSRPLGRLEAVLGHREQAEADFRRALRLHERLEAPYWIARTQLDLAALLDSPELVDAARRTIDQYGFEGLRSRVS